MEANVQCGTAFGLHHLFKFLDAAAKKISPPEEVLVEGTTFQVQSRLGEGGFSYVYLVREEPDLRGEDFALKRMLLPDGEDEDEDDFDFDLFGKTAVEREINVMRMMNHANVLPLLKHSIESGNDAKATATQRRRANMVFPVYAEGTMLDWCVRKGEENREKTFSTKQLVSIGWQVASALRYMHELDIPLAHRDVKPGNVLLESSMESSSGVKAVLMDFGSTRRARCEIKNRNQALVVQERAARECTAPFRAPELFDTPSSCKIDERVDVWSLGCLLFSGVHGGHSPFELAMHQTGGSVALAALSGKVDWPLSRSGESDESQGEDPKQYSKYSLAPVKDVVTYLLQKDWTTRPFAKDMEERIGKYL